MTLASDNSTSVAKAFQALCNSCLYCVITYLFISIFTCSLLSKWLLFNVKAKTFKLRKKINVNVDLAPLQVSSTIFSQNVFVISICNWLQV